MTITKKIFKKQECTWYIKCDKCEKTTMYRTSDIGYLGLDVIIGWRKLQERETHRLGDKRDICSKCFCKYWDRFKDFVDNEAWLGTNPDDDTEENYNSEVITVDLPLTIWMKQVQQ